MTRTSAHHGFALLMVIMLVAIGSVTVVSAGQVAIRKAVTAMRAERQLQQRWAVRSMQRYLLPESGNLLEKAEEKQKHALTTLNCSVTLGDETFDMIISDEQTKANVNMLVTTQNRNEASDTIHALLGDTNMDYHVQLKPHKAKVTVNQNDTVLPVFSSYNQLFANQPLEASHLVESINESVPIAEYLTFWGNGKVNINRVSSEVLYQVCQPYLEYSDIAIILDRRREHQEEQYSDEYEMLEDEYHYKEPADEQLEDEEQNRVGAMSVEDALKDFELEDEKKAGLNRILTDKSECFSLWVIHRMPLRSWYHLTVLEQTSEAGNSDQQQPENNQNTSQAAEQITDQMTNKQSDSEQKDKQNATEISQPTLGVFSFEW